MNRRIINLIIGFLVIGINLNSKNPDTLSTAGPGSYKILINENDTVKIPFKMRNGKPVMDLEINGKRAALMIDNGILWDPVWLFGSTIVNELKLTPVQKDSMSGTNTEEPTGLYSSKNLKLTFEEIIFYEQPVLISPPSAGFAQMFPGVDGQLSSTFFKHFIVEFDFIKSEIILHDPEKFYYKGDGSILDMQLTETGTHSVPFQITMNDSTVYKDRADLDLGGIYSFKIVLNTKHAIQPPVNAKARPFFGGTEYIAKIKSMTIGDYTFEQPIVVFGDEKTSRVHPQNLGVIGLPLFMKFNIIFDYFNNRIDIKPNKNFDKPILE